MSLEGQNLPKIDTESRKKGENYLKMALGAFERVKSPQNRLGSLVNGLIHVKMGLKGQNLSQLCLGSLVQS